MGILVSEEFTSALAEPHDLLIVAYRKDCIILFYLYDLQNMDPVEAKVGFCYFKLPERLSRLVVLFKFKHVQRAVSVTCIQVEYRPALQQEACHVSLVVEGFLHREVVDRLKDHKPRVKQVLSAAFLLPDFQSFIVAGRKQSICSVAHCHDSAIVSHEGLNAGFGLIVVFPELYGPVVTSSQDIGRAVDLFDQQARDLTTVPLLHFRKAKHLVLFGHEKVLLIELLLAILHKRTIR